jgi:poly-gamma-glutamate capsule biosynthesis protein CapA/YwtB (metallophosphatase superfamily)
VNTDKNLMTMSIIIVGTGDLVLSGKLHRSVGEATIYDRIRAADSCFSNLEMPFSMDGYPAEKLIALKCDPAHAGVLKDIGIDVVTAANNHGMDYGLEGLRTTIQTLDSIGVAHVGIGANVEEAFEPVIKTIAGIRVAYIGVTTTLPNGSGAGDSRPGLAGVRVFSKYVVDTVTIDESPGMAPFVETQTYKPDEAKLLATIRRARSEASVVLVAIHWGVPYGWIQNTQDEIATYQRPLAHAMVDAGASAIFGHHPHVVQGVELYHNVPIFYSLGNFIFSNTIVTPNDSFRTYPPYTWSSLQQTLSNIGALAKVSWTSDGKMVECSLIPMTIAEDGEPLEASDEDAKLLRSRLVALSSMWGVSFDTRKEGSGYEMRITKATTGSTETYVQ